MAGGCVVLVDEYDKPILDVLDTGLKVEVAGQERLLEERNCKFLIANRHYFRLESSGL